MGAQWSKTLALTIAILSTVAFFVLLLLPVCMFGTDPANTVVENIPVAENMSDHTDLVVDYDGAEQLEALLGMEEVGYKVALEPAPGQYVDGIHVHTIDVQELEALEKDAPINMWFETNDHILIRELDIGKENLVQVEMKDTKQLQSDVAVDSGTKSEDISDKKYLYRYTTNAKTLLENINGPEGEAPAPLQDAAVDTLPNAEPTQMVVPNATGTNLDQSTSRAIPYYVSSGCSAAVAVCSWWTYIYIKFLKKPEKPLTLDEKTNYTTERRWRRTSAETTLGKIQAPSQLDKVISYRVTTADKASPEKYDPRHFACI